MAELKERLRTDLSAAMRARDQVRLRTLRMALTAITNEEVAGNAARELSDDEVLKVLAKEAKKRREAADAFGSAGYLGVAVTRRPLMTWLSLSVKRAQPDQSSFSLMTLNTRTLLPLRSVMGPISS